MHIHVLHMFLQFFIFVKIQDDQDCQFDKYLISEGSCSQQDDSATLELEPLTMSRRISVSSFSELCLSACTEEEFCTCQEIGECYTFFIPPVQYIHVHGVAMVSYVYSH